MYGILVTQVVGWADSTPSMSSHGRQPDDQRTVDENAMARGIQEVGANAVGNLRFSTPGEGSSFADGRGGGGALAAGTNLRHRSGRSGEVTDGKLPAVVTSVGASAMAAAGAVGAAQATWGFHGTAVRSTRGGTSWTVPGNASGAAGGSAEIWPASFSAEPSLGGGEGSIAEAAAAAARKWRERAQSASIPPPVSRPFDNPARVPQESFISWADIDMLEEMGFGREHASEALCICNGSVERAAEWLLSGAEAGGNNNSSDGRGGMDGEMRIYGPHINPVTYNHESSSSQRWGSGGMELQTGTAASGLPLSIDVDDDLITNADTADCDQGLDFSEF